MITIISGTNRAGSNTLKVAKAYQTILNDKGVENVLFSMDEMSAELISPTMYNDRPVAWTTLQEKYLNPAKKFIIVFPEYNGSYPGIMKLMIDASDIGPAWNHKKVCMTGVAAGRAGGLRGLDALTNMLQYIKMNVMPNKLPISQIHTLLDEGGNFTDETTLALINTQVEEFLKY